MREGLLEDTLAMVEEISGLAAGMDEDDLGCAERIRELAEEISGRAEAQGGMALEAASLANIAQDMASGRTDFSAAYIKMCAAVSRLQSVASERERLSGDEGMSARTDSDCSALSLPARTAQTARLALSKSPEELELQLDLLEGLIQSMGAKDNHVLGVIKDFFWKIEILVVDSGEAVGVARESARLAADTLAGEISFDDGIEALRSAAGWFRGLMEGEYEGESSLDCAAATIETAAVMADAVSSGGFLEEMADDLEAFESGIEDIGYGIIETIDQVEASAGSLEEAARDAGMDTAARLFAAVKSALKGISGNDINESAKAGLKAAAECVNDILAGSFAGGDDSWKSKAEKIAIGLMASRAQAKRSQTGIAAAAPERSDTVSSICPPEVEIDVNNPELVDFVTESREYLHASEMALVELEKHPGDSGLINEIFRGYHNIKGIAGFLNLKDTQEVAHHAESLLDRARRGEIDIVGRAADAAFAAVDFLKEAVERVNAAVGGAKYETPSGYGELIERLKEPERSCSVERAAMEERLEDAPAPNSASVDACAGEVKSGGKADGMVKVSTTRLDALIDAVGELVIANAMVTQEPEVAQTKSARLSRNVSQLGKITRELQELAMSMRMVTLKNTFQKMTRLTRDLSIKCGTSVELTYSGEDTELDRNVVEEIGSPLVHMVRNAVDHGIESEQERRAAGKPAKGRIRLSAAHEGGTVVIRLKDDGRGLDKSAILSKAIAQNIVSADAELSEREIYSLIFHPGFSTAKKVTEVSGRGVGMDVVKRSIEALRGRVEIESEQGKGSEFIIRIPLTLAIIDGMVVNVAEEKYIIPTIAIVESLRPERGQIDTVVGRGEMLKVRGDLMPLFRVHRLFGLDGAKTNPTEALAVIVGENGKRCALMVDDLEGQQQVVIKALGEMFDALDGVSGGAIMGDGRVALILDTTGMVRLAHNS
jgi:two-component system chemotaxis sensor kinase CheA